MKEIYTRRSIRRFTGEKIGKQEIFEIIKAGMNAPSGKDKQPWQFYILEDQNRIDLMQAFCPYWKPMKNAGQGIMICGDLSINDDPYYHFINCAAATQNMLLKIEQMGFGACWLGIAPNLENTKKMRILYQMPEHYLPISMIALGMKNEMKEPNDRFLEDRIHYDFI